MVSLIPSEINFPFLKTRPLSLALVHCLLDVSDFLLALDHSLARSVRYCNEDLSVDFVGVGVG